MAGQALVQPFVRLFQWVLGRGGAEYPGRCIFSYPRHRDAAQPGAGGEVRAEKYTAHCDLTADGVDFESLCDWDE